MAFRRHSKRGFLHQRHTFKIRTDGSGYAQVHWFTGTNGDGAHPSSLLLASDGALYGITADGGAFNMGTLFRLRADGFGYAILAHFSDMPHPSCLVETGDGTLFGTTGSFASGDAGSVFS